MAVTGMFGRVGFIASDSAVFTYRDVSIKTSARFAKHDVLYRKPVLEYIGPESRTVSFSVLVHASLGVPPIIATQLLRSMVGGKAYRLQLGPDYLGKFVLESVDESPRHHNGRGVPQFTELKLSLKEA